MSKSSYTQVKFEGGPRAGETVEVAGEPRRALSPRGDAGLYRWEWDRDATGVRQRTGTYRYEAASGDALVEPVDGDEASALLGRAGEHFTTKDGASISPVPDLQAKDADKALRDVQSHRDQLAADQAKAEADLRPSPDTRPDAEQGETPKDGDQASKDSQAGPSQDNATTTSPSRTATSRTSASTRTKG